MPVLNFDQNAGIKWLQGTQMGANLVNQLMNQPLERQKQQELLQAQQLENQMNQQRAQVLPQSLQQQLAGQQAQTQFRQAQVPFTEAQTAGAQERTRLMPLTTAIMAQNTLNEQLRMGQTRGRFGKAYQLRQWLSQLPPADKATWIAQNPKAYATVGKMLGEAALQDPQAQLAPRIPQVLTKELFQRAGLPFNDPESPSPALRAPAVGSAPPALPLHKAAQPAVAPQPNPLPNEASRDVHFNTNPDTIRKLTLASKLQANKDLTSSKIELRREAGEALDVLLNAPAMRNSLQTLAQYQSYAGMAKGEFERLVNPEAYAEYQAAYQQLPTIISGSLKSLEGFGATDAGMKQGLDYLRMSKRFYGSDPKAAIKYFNLGIQKLNAESEALKTAASPVFKVSRRGEGPIAPLTFKSSAQQPAYTQTDLEYTAKKNNMTVAQVKKALEERDAG